MNAIQANKRMKIFFSQSSKNKQPQNDNFQTIDKKEEAMILYTNTTQDNANEVQTLHNDEEECL